MLWPLSDYPSSNIDAYRILAAPNPPLVKTKHVINNLSFPLKTFASTFWTADCMKQSEGESDTQFAWGLWDTVFVLNCGFCVRCPSLRWRLMNVEHWLNCNWHGRTEVLGDRHFPLPFCSKLHMDSSGIGPGLRVVSPTTVHLKCGMAK
jgi:hypothetical protein